MIPRYQVYLVSLICGASFGLIPFAALTALIPLTAAVVFPLLGLLMATSAGITLGLILIADILLNGFSIKTTLEKFMSWFRHNPDDSSFSTKKPYIPFEDIKAEKRSWFGQSIMDKLIKTDIDQAVSLLRSDIVLENTVAFTDAVKYRDKILKHILSQYNNQENQIQLLNKILNEPNSNLYKVFHYNRFGIRPVFLNKLRVTLEQLEKRYSSNYSPIFLFPISGSAVQPRGPQSLYPTIVASPANSKELFMQPNKVPADVKNVPADVKLDTTPSAPPIEFSSPQPGNSGTYTSLLNHMQPSTSTQPDDPEDPYPSLSSMFSPVPIQPVPSNIQSPENYCLLLSSMFPPVPTQPVNSSYSTNSRNATTGKTVRLK